jgi:hypothetical protein
VEKDSAWGRIFSFVVLGRKKLTSGDFVVRRKYRTIKMIPNTAAKIIFTFFLLIFILFNFRSSKIVCKNIRNVNPKGLKKQKLLKDDIITLTKIRYRVKITYYSFENDSTLPGE